MNRRLVMGCVAGLAALAIADGGSTYAAFSDFGDITGNSAAAGMLKLSLGPDGTGILPLDYPKLAPGSNTERTIWFRNDGQSTPDANLSVTFGNLVDTPADCSVSLGKAQGESASGISGCTITGNAATGTPAQGNLSRVLSFQGYYYPSITTPEACAALQTADNRSEPTAFFTSGLGNLHTAASTSTRFLLHSASSTPLVLHPGEGGCVSISAGWESNPGTTGTPDTPVDNAAQGDSLTFVVRFDLTQV